MSEKNGIPQVYVAIANITAAMAREGIAKGRKNQQQGYAFRGIDDVYGALSSMLAEHKLCIIPRCVERVVTERETKSGGALFGVTVAVEFDLVSAVDGSTHTARMYGEAMDSADKATNKAMSAAYKYMALEVFCIPTEGDNDADAQTHEVAAKRSEGQASGGGRPDQNTRQRGAETTAPAGPVTLDTKVPFGKKHIGKTVQEVGPDYFEWIIREGDNANQRDTKPYRFAVAALKALMPDMTTLPAAMAPDEDDLAFDLRMAKAEAAKAAK